MTVRTDLTVDFSLNPRIITVGSPSSGLSVQDLVDTIRDIEEQPSSIDNTHLLTAAGKNDLGGGLQVGITATLQNAKVAFGGWAGPEYTQCNIDGGNLVALDEDGNSMNPIQPSTFTQVVKTSSVSASLINNQLWNLSLTDYTEPGTFGDKLNKGLTTAKFIALK